MFESFFQSRSPNEERFPKGQKLTNGFPIMTYGDTPQRKTSDGTTLWKGYKQNLPLS